MCGVFGFEDAAVCCSRKVPFGTGKPVCSYGGYVPFQDGSAAAILAAGEAGGFLRCAQ